MLGSLSLASSGHLTPHGQPGGGARPPGSAPLHRLPARRPPPAEEAPHPGLRHRVSCLTPCLRPPKNPASSLQESRFGNVVRVVHIGGSRGHLRALRRQVLSSSFPALPRSHFTCAAWSSCGITRNLSAVGRFAITPEFACDPPHFRHRLPRVVSGNRKPPHSFHPPDGLDFLARNACRPGGGRGELHAGKGQDPRPCR